MAEEAHSLEAAESLSRAELAALVNASVWYAKYHEHMIAKQADDRSASALARRQRFRDLHSALHKLGVRIRRPDGLND